MQTIKNIQLPFLGLYRSLTATPEPLGIPALLRSYSRYCCRRLVKVLSKQSALPMRGTWSSDRTRVFACICVHGLPPIHIMKTGNTRQPKQSKSFIYANARQPLSSDKLVLRLVSRRSSNEFHGTYAVTVRGSALFSTPHPPKEV